MAHGGGFHAWTLLGQPWEGTGQGLPPSRSLNLGFHLPLCSFGLVDMDLSRLSRDEPGSSPSRYCLGSFHQHPSGLLCGCADEGYPTTTPAPLQSASRETPWLSTSFLSSNTQIESVTGRLLLKITCDDQSPLSIC